MEPDRSRLSVPAWLVASGIATVAAVQQVAILASFGRRYVSEDQALLWAAARSIGHLRFRQPNFWGQAYGVTFEAIPAELFRHVGLGYPTGLPLGVLLLNLAVWWIPALAAWRSGHRLAAYAAFGAPVVLSTEHAVLLVVYNTAMGRLLGAVVVAAVISKPNRTTVPLVVAFGGLAVLFDTSASLVVVPALLVLADRLHRRAGFRRAVPRAALGAVPVVAWLGFVRWWYERHPDDSMHPSPSLRPSWSVLTDNLTNPTRHFATIAPELWRSPAVVAIVVVALVVVGARWRRREALLVMGSLVVLTLVALSLPRSRDGLPTIFYPQARVLLALPLALWFAATLLGGHRTATPGPELGAPVHDSRARGREPVPGAGGSAAGLGPAIGPVPGRLFAFGLIVGLIGLTAIVRVGTWQSRISRIRGDAVAFENYPLTPAPALVGLCDRVARAAEEAATPFVAFDLRTQAYACAGVFDGHPETIYPPYERRAWVLRAADVVGPERLLLVGPTPTSCQAAGLACETRSDEMTVVELGGESPLAALRRLGVPVRSFEAAEPS